jgi:hypothetical protein
MLTQFLLVFLDFVTDLKTSLPSVYINNPWRVRQSVVLDEYIGDKCVVKMIFEWGLVI